MTDASAENKHLANSENNSSSEQPIKNEFDILRTIMDKLPDFIYVKDDEGRYLYVNEAARKILGAQSFHDVVGKSNRDFLGLAQSQSEHADDAHIAKTGESIVDREEHMLDRENNDLWLLTSKLPLVDHEGRVYGLVGIDRDITRLKTVETKLIEARDSADQANRAKGDFLANMSHEIRTPMNAIIGMTDLLLETQLDKTQREYLTMVQDSGEALLTLINDILDFSKIEAGKLELDASSFDIREALGDTMKSLGLRAYSKGLELAVQIDPEIPRYLIGDAGRVRQILVNLIGNAIKFTNRGEVVLEIFCDSKTSDHAQLKFVVTDTGIGIPPDKCGTVFEKFEQADTSTTRRFGGTGLGLAICSRLVKIMKGDIWVESTVGHGSTFRFTAEFEIDKTLRAQSPEENLVVVSGLRVLIVDDNATNRRILKDILTNWDMSPTTTSNATQAMQSLRDAIAEDDPICLVISDVNMPDVDGIHLASVIVEQDLLSPSSVIMLTSGARPDDVTRLKEIGISHQLMKPIKQSELFGAITSALDNADLSTISAPIGTEIKEDQSRHLKILLAEDNAVNQKLALGILGNLGHDVTIANNGREACNLVGTATFDLILMDVQMPEMDGLTATAQIRRNEDNSGGHIPIIAMTAHAMQGDRERCLAAGMDDYLSKPIRLQDIGNKLADMFPIDGSTNLPKPKIKKQLDDISVKNDSTIPTISWDAALKNVAGIQSLLMEVLQAFLDDMPRLVSAGEQAISNNDAEALNSAAHSIKGSLLFLASPNASGSAERIETLAEAGDLATASQEFRSFMDIYSSIVAQVKQYLDENQSI